MWHLAADLDPVVQKDRLHLSHHRPLDLKMRVAPVLRILGMASPLRSNTNTAGEANFAIDNQELSVGAVIELSKRVPTYRVISLYIHPGIRHDIEDSLVNLRTAHPVQQHVNFDPCFGSLGQGFRESLAYFPGPVNI
ncbi:hypothetical protein D9M70_408110 [compost metagenome]